MGILDFLKKNKNIENDNGLNEIYDDNGRGKLWRRYYKKNGKKHGRDEHYLSGNLFVVEDFDNGESIGIERYHEDSWLKEKRKGNLHFWYSGPDTLMTYDEVSKEILKRRPSEESLRSDVKTTNEIIKQSGGKEKDVEKVVQDIMKARLKQEGVFFINDFAFEDNNYPNPYTFFSGDHENIKYVEGIKQTTSKMKEDVKMSKEQDKYNKDNDLPDSMKIFTGQTMYKRDMSGLLAYFKEKKNMERIFNELTHAIRNGMSVKKYLTEIQIIGNEELMHIAAQGFSDVAGFLKDMLEINDNSELRKDYNACIEAIKILQGK